MVVGGPGSGDEGRGLEGSGVGTVLEAFGPAPGPVVCDEVQAMRPDIMSAKVMIAATGGNLNDFE